MSLIPIDTEGVITVVSGVKEPEGKIEEILWRDGGKKTAEQVKTIRYYYL